jgi:hypothetical protein
VYLNLLLLVWLVSFGAALSPQDDPMCRRRTLQDSDSNLEGYDNKGTHCLQKPLEVMMLACFRLLLKVIRKFLLVLHQTAKLSHTPTPASKNQLVQGS